MADNDDKVPADARDSALQAQVVESRDGGASWHEIQVRWQLTRQQARYAYQLGKRVERRKASCSD